MPPATRLWRFAWLLAGVLVAIRPGPVAALDPSRSLSELHHESWTQEDGAPSDVWALAQSAEGWLWIGTPSGLFQFDGVKFRRFEARDGQRFRSTGVSALLALPTGELWMGHRHGGVSLLRDGVLTQFGEKEGLVATTTTITLESDGKGVIWAATFDGLFRYENGRWKKVGADWNYPFDESQFVFRDDADTLWTANGKALYKLEHGQRHFEPTGIPATDVEFIYAPDGALWISDEGGVRRLTPQGTRTQSRNDWMGQRASNTTMFDRGGALWSVRCKRGICRMPNPAASTGNPMLMARDATEAFASPEGLSADFAMTLLEDREGNIWVATKGGIDRFRDTRFKTAALPSEAVGFALAADTRGQVFASSRTLATGDWLWRIDGKGPPQRFGGELGPIGAADTSPAGDIWFAGAGGLWKLREGTFLEIPVPEAVKGSDALLLGADGDGVWLSLQRAGLHRLQGDVWSAATDLELPKSQPTALAVAGKGHVWLGYLNSRVIEWREGVQRNFDTRHGLDVGTVTGVHPGSPVMVAGESGLAILINGRFHKLKARNSDALLGITGLVASTNGDMWLNGASGVVRIVAEQVRTFATDPERTIEVELFNFLDGVPGSAQAYPPQRSAIQGSDGRLWFAGTKGIAWIDPDRIARNPHAPTVHILALRSGNTSYAVADGVELPERTSSLEVDFTALSLTMPTRVHFRYRLEGVDPGWINAGSRREAFYSNLDPGRYRFQVEAANNDGVWSTTPASLRFSIKPTFFQTRSFFVLCVIVALTALWLAYLFRMRSQARHLQETIEAENRERERIARDLHDTLLQGIQGMLLRLQTWAADPAQRTAFREEVADVAEQARGMLVEGRDRIIALRREPGDNDLVEAIGALGARYAEIYPAKFVVDVLGGERDLRPEARDEIRAIAREAIHNAYTHASATRIDVTILFAESGLGLTVRDDGCGIEDSVIRDGRRVGHWGLVGIRERARHLDATVTLSSCEPSGTELCLAIPARSAYAPAKRRWFGPRDGSSSDD